MHIQVSQVGPRARNEHLRISGNPAYIGCMLQSPVEKASAVQAPGAARFPVAGFLLALERKSILWLRERAARRRPKAEAAHLRTGRRGELEAMFYLRSLGYLIADRRWRTRGLNGDIDMVAWDGDTLVMVEVKTRTRHDAYSAESTIDEAKRRMLFKMARAYTRTLPDWEQDPAPVRFDVVAVYLIGDAVECTLTRNAFRPE